jgi:hypothetical protein
MSETLPLLHDVISGRSFLHVSAERVNTHERAIHETSLHCGWLFYAFSTVRRVDIYRIIVENNI